MARILCKKFVVAYLQPCFAAMPSLRRFYACLGALLFPWAVWAQTAIPAYLPGCVVVKIKPEFRNYCTPTAIQVPSLLPVLQSLGATAGAKFGPDPNLAFGKTNNLPPTVDLSLIYDIRFSNSLSVERVVEMLAADPAVAYAEPHYVYAPAYTPNDPSAGQQWYLNRIQAIQAWDISRGDTNVVIAIVDDAVQWNHPDLIGNVAFNRADPINGIDDDRDGYIDNFRGWDFIGASDLNPVPDNDPSPSVNTPHGTNVTGYAAATTDNGIGVAGVGFRCRFLPIKTAADVNSSGQNLIIAGFEGIKYAADKNANIINCSWGGSTFSQAGQDVINYAVAKGSIVMAAAGNNNNEVQLYPAAYRGVISVASTDQGDLKAGTSTYGTWLTLCSPGGAAPTTAINSSYTSAAVGLATSFASPIAAGAAAIIKSQFPNLTNQQVGERLRVTADKIDFLNPTLAGKLGSGRINLQRALTVNLPSVRYQSFTLLNRRNLAPAAGDTANLVVTFRNFLSPTTNLQVQLATADANVAVLGSTANMGAIGTLTTAANGQQPFRLRVLPTCPLNRVVTLQLSYTDGSFTDTEYFTVIVNQTFVTLNTGKLQLSLNSRGNLGFNDFPTNTQGAGLRFLNGNNLLSEGGFLVSNAANAVMDNIRNTSQVVQDANLTATFPLQFNQPGPLAPLQALIRFDDSGAGANRLGLVVRQEALAYNFSPEDQFVILRYTLRNTNALRVLNGLYAGLFADFDISSNSANDSARYDAARRMAFATGDPATPNKTYTGLMALGTTLPGQSFAGRSNTFVFSDANKFRALSTPDSSIVNKGDVVQFLSQGPFNLLPNDSIQVSFVVLAAGSLQQLRNKADSARIKFNCLTGTPFRVSLGRDTTVCGQLTLAPQATGATTYQWTNGRTTPTIPVSTSGTYGVRVLNATGCSDFAQINVTVVPQLQMRTTVSDTLASTAKTIAFRDSTLGATTWLWTFGDGFGFTGQNTTYRYRQPGTYTVRLVTSNNVCTQTFTRNVRITVPTNILPETTTGELRVYPNPASGQLFVSRAGLGRGTLYIDLINTQGQVVISQIVEPALWSADYALPLAVPAGLYLVRLAQGERQWAVKLLVQ